MPVFAPRRSPSSPSDGTLRKLVFHFLLNWMEYDRGDSFPFDLKPNVFPFGSKSKGKLFPLQVFSVYACSPPDGTRSTAIVPARGAVTKWRPCHSGAEGGAFLTQKPDISTGLCNSRKCTYLNGYFFFYDNSFFYSIDWECVNFLPLNGLA